MTKIQAVIGANYGDEGKGLTTDFLCGEAVAANKSCLVIMSNGGAQRGHTVETEEGERFVFHHLGSGSLLGIGSYFCADFLLNPMMFLKDWDQLMELWKDKKDVVIPPLFYDEVCRFTTPYDMMINRILEEARGEARHGSVGLGIWETVRRYEKGFGLTIGSFLALSPDAQVEHLQDVRRYGEERILQKLGRPVESLDGWKELWNSEELMLRFVSDCVQMTDRMQRIHVSQLARYDILVVENAQGVLLGQSRFDGMDYTTPSDTGAREIRRLLDAGCKDFVTDTELYYVTRTYRTRHGAGRFTGECPAEAICPDICDLTNVDNAYQGSIRYGMLDPVRLVEQLAEDMQDMERYPFAPYLVITHANEAPAAPVAAAFAGKRFYGVPVQILISDGHTRHTVCRERITHDPI